MLDFPLSVVIHGTKRFFPIKPSMMGQTLSHYHITDHIMQGALGEVYLADDTTQNRQVLLKILSTKIRRDANRIRRIREDVEAAARLSHPAMARIYGLEQSVDDTGLSIQFISIGIYPRSVPRRPDSSGRPVSSPYSGLVFRYFGRSGRSPPAKYHPSRYQPPTGALMARCFLCERQHVNGCCHGHC